MRATPRLAHIHCFILPPENYFCLRSAVLSSGLRSSLLHRAAAANAAASPRLPITEREGPQIVSTRSVDHRNLFAQKKNFFCDPGMECKTMVCLHAGTRGSPVIVADENNLRTALSREIFAAYAKTILCLQ
jgi:hypothetical protein